MDNDQFAKTMLTLTKAHPEAAKVVKEYRASNDRLLWFGDNDEHGQTDDKFSMTMVGSAGGRTVDVVTVLDSGRLGTYGVVDDFLWVADIETLAEEATMTVDDTQVSTSTSFGDPLTLKYSAILASFRT